MEVVMPITDWPAMERPREKLLARGPAQLSDAELLAVLLRTGLRGHSALALARDLLARYGNLRSLLNTPAGQLGKEPGIGPAKTAQLQAALELARRHLGHALQRGEHLTDPTTARRYLHAQLRDREREVFACLLLDTKHRVLHFEELFHGTLDAAQVHPREVVRLALAHNAAALIVAHNHPSGVAEPSRCDEAITRRLVDALELVGIRLLDHIVIGDTETVSLAERGLL
jgi:DNA repair protein RadC